VEYGQHNGTAIHDDLLPTQPRAHKGSFFGSPVIQARKNHAYEKQAKQANSCRDANIDEQIDHFYMPSLK
jgi:hypothetical protein